MKLIVFLNLKGSYKGGAVRRYINLFKELQKIRDDYYLLINQSLYNACIFDNFLISDKNIIVKKVKFDVRNYNTDSKITPHKKKHKNRSKTRMKIGALKAFLKHFLAWLHFNFTLYKILKQYKIKSVYSVSQGGTYSWILLKLLNIKFVFSYMDASTSMVSKKVINFFKSEYWPLKYADKIDFLSERIIYSLEKKSVYINKNRLLITPNSFIDYSRFIPKETKDIDIAFCSRLHPWKNPELFIDSLILLKTQFGLSPRVSIIGDGEIKQSLEKKAEKLKNITFHGGMSNPETILSRSRIFISIQNDNNYPSQSLIEAMACENAIIASNVGETRKLVTEKEGVLVSLTKKNIADGMKYLLNNLSSTKIMGQRAREKVLKEQSIEKYVEYFIKITQ